MCNGDTSLLIKHGEPTKEQLEEAWDQIITEVCTLIDSDKMLSIGECYHNILSFSWKITFLKGATKYLKEVGYDTDLAKRISALGYPYIEEIKDRQAYLNQIYLVENEAKTLIVLLNQYKAQYAAMVPNNTEADLKGDMKYYDKELMFLSKFQGHKINRNKTTVREYYAIANNYLEEVRQKKQHG